jgi:hypothetical protein
MEEQIMISTHTRSSLSRIILVLAILSLSGITASASVITAFGGASGPGLASMSFNEVVTPAPGNDNVVGASPNYVSINQKAFGSTAIIDMTFIVEDFGVPTTEYVFIEGVSNGSLDNWMSYQIKLGFGTGAGFVLSSLGDGLDFDSPEFDSPFDFAPYPTVSLGEDVINVADALFMVSAFHTFTFTVDVPAGISEFTVRQEPREESVATEPTAMSRVKSLY